MLIGWGGRKARAYGCVVVVGRKVVSIMRVTAWWLVVRMCSKGARPITKAFNSRKAVRMLTSFTPWSRVLPERLAGSQLVKKFLAFYGSRRFITTITRARPLSLSQWRTLEFCSGGFQQIQLRTERTGIWGAVAPLVKYSGGSCNLVQEISFHIVKFY